MHAVEHVQVVSSALQLDSSANTGMHIREQDAQLTLTRHTDCKRDIAAYHTSDCSNGGGHIDCTRDMTSDCSNGGGHIDCTRDIAAYHTSDGSNGGGHTDCTRDTAAYHTSDCSDGGGTQEKQD